MTSASPTLSILLKYKHNLVLFDLYNFINNIPFTGVLYVIEQNLEIS